jgi:hypothetical protein
MGARDAELRKLALGKLDVHRELSREFYLAALARGFHRAVDAFDRE